MDIGNGYINMFNCKYLDERNTCIGLIKNILLLKLD